MALGDRNLLAATFRSSWYDVKYFADRSGKRLERALWRLLSEPTQPDAARSDSFCNRMGSRLNNQLPGSAMLTTKAPYLTAMAPIRSATSLIA